MNTARPTPQDVARLLNGELTDPEQVAWLMDWHDRDPEIARWFFNLDVEEALEDLPGPLVLADAITPELAAIQQSLQFKRVSRIAPIKISARNRRDLISGQAVTVSIYLPNEEPIPCEITPVEMGQCKLRVQLPSNVLPLNFTVVDLQLNVTPRFESCTESFVVAWPKEQADKHREVWTTNAAATIEVAQRSIAVRSAHCVPLVGGALAARSSSDGPKLYLDLVAGAPTLKAWAPVREGRSNELLMVEFHYPTSRYDNDMISRPIFMTEVESQYFVKTVDVPLPPGVQLNGDTAKVTVKLSPASTEDVVSLDSSTTSRLLANLDSTELPIHRQMNEYILELSTDMHERLVEGNATWLMRWAPTERSVA